MAEMIIVISVIAILVTVGMYSFSKLLPRGRDQRRQADLAQIQFALEKYRSDNPTISYPTSAGCEPGIGGCLSVLVTNNYLTKIPDDNTSNAQYYYSTFMAGNVKRYELCAYLDTNPPSGGGSNCLSNTTFHCGTNIACNYRVTGP